MVGGYEAIFDMNLVDDDIRDNKPWTDGDYHKFGIGRIS